MDNTALSQALQSQLGTSLLAVEESFGMLAVTVAPDALFAALAYLKNKLAFGFLTDLCGIHYPERAQLGAIYHLHNMQDNIRIRVKAFVPVQKPKLQSATPLYHTANWMERETFDFYGIRFEGHPDLRRILNVDYLDYFPLRKEYQLEDPTREDKDDTFFGR